MRKARPLPREATSAYPTLLYLAKILTGRIMFVAAWATYPIFGILSWTIAEMNGGTREMDAIQV